MGPLRIVPPLALAVFLAVLTPPPIRAHAVLPAGAGQIRPMGSPPDSIAPKAPSPRDYLAEARASFTPENRAYQRIRIALAVVSPLVAVAAGVLMLFTGVAQRFRDSAFRLARGRWARALIFFAPYSVTLALVTLPLDWYGGFFLEHRFGLSNQSLGAWAVDQLKALAFEIVSTPLTVAPARTR